MEIFEKTVEKNYVYKGRIINVRCDKAELHNGNPCTREVVEHNGGVCIAPITENKELIFVRQFRYPYMEMVLELPAGKLELGEDPFDAGKRELEEETDKKEINPRINDRTNVTNDFQGALRFGYLERREQTNRIEKDWVIVKDNPRFKKTMAITHCNEYKDESKTAEYMSDSPYRVTKRE